MKTAMNRLLALLATLPAMTSSQAAMVIDIAEVGSDVVFSYSGSVNLASSPSTSPSSETLIAAAFGSNADDFNYFEAIDGTADVFNLAIIASPAFGGGPQGGGILASASSNFLLQHLGGNQQIWLPSGYVSNEPISGSVTFANNTIAGLGINPGNYVWTWAHNGVSDSATFDIVPEPTNLFLLAVGGLALLRRRR